jgi:2C-methyl-D-erythritol 2,4-cyclodiphosphate synthase
MMDKISSLDARVTNNMSTLTFQIVNLQVEVIAQTPILTEGISTLRGDISELKSEVSMLTERMPVFEDEVSKQ